MIGLLLDERHADARSERVCRIAEEQDHEPDGELRRQSTPRPNPRHLANDPAIAVLLESSELGLASGPNRIGDAQALTWTASASVLTPWARTASAASKGLGPLGTVMRARDVRSAHRRLRLV